VLLTVLVVLHHAFIAYGGPGGWYYRQPATNLRTLLPITIFVSTNQSFFMGLFFLLAAYFIEPSLKRKGTWVYLKDRFKRLVIPLLFYSLVLSPGINFMAYRYGFLKKDTLAQYLSAYNDWANPGVLWFVVALLLFTLVFVALYNLKLTGSRSISKLQEGYVLLVALGLGFASFLLRLVFPVGWVLMPFGFILGHFPQYIVMFTVGVMASRGKLAENLDLKLAKRFAWLAVALLFIFFPFMFYVKTITGAPTSNFNGGPNLEALMYSFYEQLLGISIVVALTGISRFKWNKPSKLMSALSRNSFAVYLFHPLILVAISLLLSRVYTTPTVKLAIAAPTAVICSFLFAEVILKIPGVNRII